VGRDDAPPTARDLEDRELGGPDKSGTLRSRSTITAVDEALAKWWTAFKHLDRDAAAGASIDALVRSVEGYLAHKENKENKKKTERAEKKARVAAAQRLLDRAKDERTRLADWKLLVPPTVDAVKPLAAGHTVDEFASGADFMELRTTLPTLKLWKEESSVFLAIRATSQVVELVDRPLEMFWKALLTKHRAHTLRQLSMLSSSAAQYLWHKDYDASGFRVDAVFALRRRADEEYERLSREWPSKGPGLPPIVADNDSLEDPGLHAEAEAGASDLSKEIDAAALHGVTPADVTRMLKAETGESDEASIGPLAKVLNDRMTPWFGRSRAYAQILHAPADASRDILTLYKSEKKWVTRQVAAIQACSIIKYPLGVSAAAEKKFRTKPAELAAHLEKYNTFFEKVVSVADHAARRVFKDANLSAWKVLDELGWTRAAPTLVLPMMSIITLLVACKWKESKTSTVVGGVVSYGVMLSVVTGASLGMTIVTTSETATKMIESVSGATPANFAPHANIAVHGAGLSILGAVGAGISIPLSAYQVGRALYEHGKLSTMLERFATLQTACPELGKLLDTSPFFMRLRLALFGKLGRRQTRAKITAIGGTAGIAGATTTTCVAVWAGTAVANIWNPVGWTLAGIGAVASFGLLIYKHRERRAQEAALIDMRTKYAIPPFVKTKGEFERYMIADLIYRAALNDVSIGMELLAIGYALLYLVFGGSLHEARSNAISMGHVGIMAFIKG
jgi:hypothetical protein